MSESNFRYKAGSCLIGSLLWDTSKKHRNAWRGQSLLKIDKDNLIPVSLPIRYGRFSDTWKAPTMVFSSKYYKEGKLGQGFAIRFKQKSCSVEELIEQARAMSIAEGEHDDKFIKGNKEEWCILLCWINPDMEAQKRDHFLKVWTNAYESGITDEIQAQFKMGCESQAVFDKSGELQFEWPVELKDFDVVFATQTQPRKKDNDRAKYFTSKELCKLFSQNKEYFIGNVQKGILTYNDSHILRNIIDKEAIIYYRDKFRAARYQALLNAENFAPLLFVLESFGTYLARICESDDQSLDKLKKYLKAFISDSPYLHKIPNKFPVYHCEFDFLYEFVRDTRNEFAHQGVYARQKTRFILELCLIFESKLNELQMKASNYAVSGVTTTELWQPLSLIKKEMLINSYSYLPVKTDKGWELISDYNLADYLKGSKTKRAEKESQTLKEALNEDKYGKLETVKADVVSPSTDISKIKLSSTQPILVVGKAEDPETGEMIERLHGLYTGFDLL